MNPLNITNFSFYSYSDELTFNEVVQELCVSVESKYITVIYVALIFYFIYKYLLPICIYHVDNFETPLTKWERKLVYQMIEIFEGVMFIALVFGAVFYTYQTSDYFIIYNIVFVVIFLFTALVRWKNRRPK